MSDIVVFGSFVVDLMARSAHIPVPGESRGRSAARQAAGSKRYKSSKRFSAPPAV